MYEIEILDEDIDDGTMPYNVEQLGDAVIGHRIVSVERTKNDGEYSYYSPMSTRITLDSGTTVELVDTDDCCAHTSLEGFLLHPESVDHIITGVGTTDGYQTWHIFADMGDVLTLDVGWSSGNPFYYGYGFRIKVK